MSHEFSSRVFSLHQVIYVEIARVELCDACSSELERRVSHCHEKFLHGSV